MKITIVYESMFGNTHQVAQAIGDGVRQAAPDAAVECVPVGDTSPEHIESTDLLVVGGPTHIRGMTTGFSRKLGISGEEKAEAKGEPAHDLEADAEGSGVREWFDQLPKAKEGAHAAAFDTRLGSLLAGGAAHGIARRLRKHGYHLVSDPEGFVVDANLWAGWPLGPAQWPLLDIGADEFIKVEEFIDGDHLVIRAELPGVDPDRDIDVSVDNGVLTIAAERQESSREQLEKGYRSEFRYGSFVRQVQLPAGTSAEVVSAAYQDGVLEIRMPKPTPEAAPRRIQIQRG